MAESFGTDAQRYDRARPGYPDALVARIVAGSPGPDVLDVGCGTGIAARQFQTAGCAVLGVEPDARMAEFARACGLQIRETGRFNEPEQWRFDWERTYTRDQWLALLPTIGGLTQLPPDKTAVILEAVGTAVDTLGGRFTMQYTTLATTAARTGTS
jgi:SAM-dependent methyltransferase